MSQIGTFLAEHADGRAAPHTHVVRTLFTNAKMTLTIKFKTPFTFCSEAERPHG